MRDSLDAAVVREWCACALVALRRHQREIDELNVYPVPDGDTGTNLVLTMTAAAEALDGQPFDTPAAALRALARGALLGARGNSGVILSQLLRGLADAVAATPSAGGRALAAALAAAADAAYRAVAEPVEGTMLSVARAAADGALTVRGDDVAMVVRAAVASAARALARTPEQLPALARAGVVDAGGRGLCVVLDALAEVVTGAAAAAATVAPGPAGAAARGRAETFAVRESGSDDYAYEVQYLLDASDAAVARLRAVLEPLGDSLVVVGSGEGTWNVHVHVNDVGAAIEAGVRAGRPYRISVTRFADQVTQRADAGPAQPAASAPDPERRAVVVVCSGPGLADLFTAEGALVVTAAGGGTPSTGEILDAIRGSGAGLAVVLPNDPDAAAVANVAAAEAREAGIRTAVVPTRSVVQALAALAVRDPRRRFEDDVIAMAEAAGACRYAELTTATRAALTVAGRCEPGDVLGLVDGEVNLIGHDLTDTAKALLDRLLAVGGELVTLLVGAGAPARFADTLTAHVAEHWPFVEVAVYDGGQPHYPLLVGVE